MPEIDERTLRHQLERLVELLPAESAPYLEERPRFAHAVLVYANEKPGELITASCIKQLDPDVFEEHIRYTNNNEYSNSADYRSDEETEETEIPPVEVLKSTVDLPCLPLAKFVRNGTETGAQYHSAFLVENNSPTTREEHLVVGRSADHDGPIYVRRETQRTTIDRFDPNAKPIEVDSRTFRIPPQGTTYERPEVVSRTYRSTVEETTFPSIDRYRTVRSETQRFVEPRSPRLATPLETRTTHTTTTTISNVPQPPEDDAITQAVRILQESCDLLDETADKIARRRLLDGRDFRFPSESRKTTA
ncbi:hypothetical protein M3Y98_00008100 [Aphelenchoides besseyi]|nr:hypothetical protein M3Y98_00008100 [Aphelenchoides besseyi]